MSGIVKVNIDTRKLSERISELGDALIGAGQGGDAATIFEDESRRFLQQVIRLTPPRNRAQGESAIDRDMLKIFEPLNGDFLDDLIIAHGHSNIDEWLTTAGGEKKHINFTYADNTGGPMRDFHYRNRDTRGRTYNLKRQRDPSVWYAPYVVSYENFTAYAKKMKSHVGRKKAAWGKSFVALGGKLSSWISRHIGGAMGEFHQVNDPMHPSITMISRAPGVSQDAHFIQGALRVRYEAIGKRIRLVVSGYSKDVAQGMKIQRKAHKSPDSMQEAE